MTNIPAEQRSKRLDALLDKARATKLPADEGLELHNLVRQRQGLPPVGAMPAAPACRSGSDNVWSGKLPYDDCMPGDEMGSY